MTRTISRILGSAFILSGLTGTALAGGLERGGYNYDLLFSEDRFASEAGVIYVMPNRKIKNARDTDQSDGLGANGIPQLGLGKTLLSETENYSIPRASIKIGITSDFDCLAQYSQPWGVHTKPGNEWVGVNENIETKISSDEYGLTCSYKFNVGGGQLRAIGGISYQEIEGFKERLVLSPNVFRALDSRLVGFPGDGTGRLQLEGDGIGWRIGAAYEIPEIAFRASLIYNGEVDLGDVAGKLDLSELPPLPINPLAGRVTNVFGTAALPQSIEFKLQSGIAPDWLAFGSVKWVDWSILNIVGFCAEGTPACTPDKYATSLDLMFRDGWTVTGGVGHKFNDQWSGQVQVSWDRGTSTGLTTQTDTWLLSSGVSWSPNKNFEIRAGGAVGLLTSGSFGGVRDCDNRPGKCGTSVEYDFGDDFVSALSISGKLKF
ncbi:OmpP1/FadL family transporter [Phyllobacterium sp. YR531]|uniref:OmpP1/FadL family transporter n=1 Tax=Phyllobacterium sp. YR531 TaxID=1144343 RepID=UPI00026F6CEF|nr:OmpP1/FadL family transporter [Phyllobacterium sp. YR531]EJN01612.1 long-chain fatty acid transport protein [Phyllobacterium sp. YR531]